MRSSAIGARLRQARESANLSGRKASQLAGLAIDTAHSIESTGRMPGIDTVERIANVLKVSAIWLAYGSEPIRRVLNYRWAPGHSPLRWARDLDALLQGAGGRIDHSFLYFDPMGAALYEEVSRSPEARPLKEAAKMCASMCKEPISVVALGSGLAHLETALAQHLVPSEVADGLDAEPPIELYLVDSSPSLLGDGFRHASNTLDCLSIPVVAIEGDFRRLPTFSETFAPRGPRRRLFTLLGYTLGNLDNEASFLRDSLLCANRGDFLLLDFGVQTSKLGGSAASLRNEPGWVVINSGGTVRNNRWLAFFAGPVTRQLGAEGVSVQLRHAEDSGVFPNSFSVEFVVDTSDCRRFVTACWRRYEAKSLIDSVAKTGWQLVQAWSFGEQRPSQLALFVRQ